MSAASPSSETGPLLLSFVLAFGYSPQLAAISAGFPLFPLALFALEGLGGTWQRKN